MGLLGTSMDDPQTAGILALAGQMIRGDMGGGLLGFGQAYQGAQNSAVDRADKLQQIKLRDLQAQMLQRKQEMMNNFFSAGGVPASAAQPSQPGIDPSPGGALGSGTFGIPTGGQPAASAVPASPSAAMSRIAGMTADQVAAFKVATGEDLTPIWKIAKEGFTKNPNTYSTDVNTGRTTYNPDPSKGISYNPDTQTVGVLNGFPQTQATLSLASELPKALATAAGTTSLRKNADGTESPVNGLQENSVLGPMFAAFMGGGANGMPPTVPSQQPGRPLTNQGNLPMTPQLQALIQADAARNGIPNPAVNLNMPASGQRLPMIGLAGQQDTQAPPVVRMGNAQPGIGYGMTTAQQAAAAAQTEAAKTGAIESTKSGQAYKDALNDKVGNDYSLVFRNSQIAPLLDKFQTGGLMPEERLHLANAINTTGWVPGGMKSMVNSWAGGDPTAGKVIENQLAAAGITNLLQTLDKEGKPNRAEFQIMNDARESLKSGNASLKDVFELQKRLYDVHYNEQQALAQAEKSGSYDPRTWAADYSAVKHADLSKPVQPLPSAPSAPAAPSGPTFAAMPPANPSNKGKFLRDTTSNKRYQSNGLSWVEVK